MINNMNPMFFQNPIPFFQNQLPNPAQMKPEATLYVGNLSPLITDVIFFGIVTNYGRVVSCHVMKDRYTRQSREFGFVTYADIASATKAQQELNFKVEFQRELRVYFKKNTHEFDKEANLIIKNLPKNITSKKLNEQCEAFGKVHSCFSKSIQRNSKIEYCGFGYVQFEKLESAEAMKAFFENNLFCDQKLLIQKYIPAISREKVPPRNLYVKEFPKSWKEDQVKDFIKNEFGAFGEIQSSSVNFYKEKESYYAFVCYKSGESASKAIAEMSGKVIEDATLFVSISQTPSQRFSEKNLEALKGENFTNLYIRSLKPSVTIESITELFSTYGTVTSVALGDYKKQLVSNQKETAQFCDMKFGYVNFKEHKHAAAALGGAKTDKKIREVLVNDKDQQFISVFQSKNIRNSFQVMKRNMYNFGMNAKMPFNNPSANFRKKPAHHNTSNFGSLQHSSAMGTAFDSGFIPNSNVMSQQSATPTTPSKQPEGLVLNNEDFLGSAMNLRKNKDQFMSMSAEEQKNTLGTLMYQRIKTIFKKEDMIPKITGMLIDMEVLEFDEIMEIIEDEALLKERIDEAIEVIEENNNNEEEK